MNELNALKNIVRIGRVSTVNAENRTARVIFQDKANLVSGPLIVLKNQPSMWLPHVGQLVLCLYLPNGESDGFVIGGI